MDFQYNFYIKREINFMALIDINRSHRIINAIKIHKSHKIIHYKISLHSPLQLYRYPYVSDDNALESFRIAYSRASGV
jgi:hypothetical protein